MLEIRGDREIDLLALDHPDRIGNQRFVTLSQEADDVEHSTQRPRGVCPTAEPKDVQPVAGLELPHEKLVRVRDIVGNAIPKGETKDARPPLRNSRERGSRADRADARMVVGDLCPVRDQRLVEIDDVRVLLPELIARAIATNDDRFGHESGLSDERKSGDRVNLPRGRTPVAVAPGMRVLGL